MHNHLKNLDALLKFPFIIKQNGHIINIQKYASDLRLGQAPEIHLKRLALPIDRQ
jgi:hypothetical protein